jgi:Ser/Thr protein kinase RdoA (MazF antagonist)
MLESARVKVSERLADLGFSPDRFGLIHADPTPTNVLIKGGNPAALVDFDDCGFGWFVYDLAVALWEYEEEEYFPALKHELLSGYLDVAGREPLGVELLPVFLMARRLALLGWLGTRSDSQHASATGERRIRTTPGALIRFLDTF